MIKVNGLNCPQGSRSYYLFKGNGNGNRIGDGYNFGGGNGNGFGDGYSFGNKNGSGYSFCQLKKEFQK